MLAFCALLGLFFVLAFLGKTHVRIPMENSRVSTLVEEEEEEEEEEEDCAMDSALPFPGGIVDGQQEVVHTNM